MECGAKSKTYLRASRITASRRKSYSFRISSASACVARESLMCLLSGLMETPPWFAGGGVSLRFLFRVRSGFAHMSEGLTGAAFHLLRRNVLDVLPQRPDVAEGVLELAVTVTPELVRQGHGYRRSGTDGLVEYVVDTVHVEVQYHRATTQRLGRKRAHSRELVVQHEFGVADPEFRVHYLSVRSFVNSGDLRTECFLVELERLLSTVHHQVGSNRMRALRNSFHCHIVHLLSKVPGWNGRAVLRKR